MSHRLGRVRQVSNPPSATTIDPAELEAEFGRVRRELTGYCYRMLGSGVEAEDAVQDTMTKAWRAIGSFEGRSSLRSWLYRIATNVCMDMHRAPQRRARPMDMTDSSTVSEAQLRVQPDQCFVQPIADERVLDVHGDPATVATARESLRLAFVAALQHLPPRQRSVLILRSVLQWSAAETAALLDTSTASVNSALQRARATLEGIDIERLDPVASPAHDELIARYVDAFERYDMDALVRLLRDDAIISMPPHDLWLQGAEQVVGWMIGPGIGCRNSKLLAVQANGTAAFGSYKPAGDGRWEPWALQVIEVSGGAISGHHNFLFPALFAEFGLPASITEP